ncbi:MULTISPECIES: SMI1/KNR4 family protein [unclassified Myxococcus]|uniref:SMI1/KNR4 family protein n=1 Tax=unclassified Myxococcus TaxID=2648731 RepID=UPI00157B50B3|nr:MULTISPECIES: SMI1/KNR4 family protein [unclassified Myxococcus]NTX04857.1 SMI1/KNR4 family protein [Myxococcus sp. CA040A]NTX36202.1 SMI1/KNR4 family protein [Myxococcus sp. CA033]NTX58465.1 SMI1/KNR4 family protein [Myxococcus sp. CA039A]
MPQPPEDLARALERLDVAIRRADPGGHASFLPPAAPEQLAGLEAEIGTALPGDLRALFSWHDGTARVSFDGSSVYSMMGCVEAISTRRFLLGPDSDGARFSEHWVPVLTKGNGDHVAYVLSGTEAGPLVEYRHDDASRPIWAPSLAALVARALRTWESKPVRQQGALMRIGGWSRECAVHVGALGVGDAIVVCTLGAAMRPFWNLYVQVDANRWVWGFSGAEDWEPEALAVASRAIGGPLKDTSTVASSVDGLLLDNAWTLEDRPPRAPDDLSMLGVYRGRVVRA